MSVRDNILTGTKKDEVGIGRGHSRATTESLTDGLGDGSQHTLRTVKSAILSRFGNSMHKLVECSDGVAGRLQTRQ